MVLVFFVVVAFTGFHAHNLSPFMPMGWKGVGAAAASIFFSYIGIDAVSTAGEEVKDPRRTLPAGIVLSLLIVTAIYILVAVAAIGAQPWTAFAGQEAGLAVILRNLTGQAWTSAVEEQSLWRGLFKKQTPPVSPGVGLVVRDASGPVDAAAPLEPHP